MQLEDGVLLVQLPCLEPVAAHRDQSLVIRAERNRMNAFGAFESQVLTGRKIPQMYPFRVGSSQRLAPRTEIESGEIRCRPQRQAQLAKDSARTRLPHAQCSGSGEVSDTFAVRSEPGREAGSGKEKKFSRIGIPETRAGVPGTRCQNIARSIEA